MTGTRPRRRWLRLSLRGLMVLVLILGGGFGFVVNRAHRRRDAVAAIIAGGGSVRYAWQINPRSGMFTPTPTPPGPKWLVDWLGVDYFATATWAKLGRGATDPALEAVKRLSRLRFLDLSNTALTDGALADLAKTLPDLEWLDLGQTWRVTSACLPHLTRLGQLRTLTLNWMKIRDADLAALRGHPSLARVSLTGTGVGDEGVAHLAALPHLRELWLSGTRVTNAGLAHLRGHRELQTLSIAGTKVSDLTPIGPLPALRDLYLGGSTVTDAGLTILDAWPRLATLDLDRTRVTDAGLAHLAAGRHDLVDLGLGATVVSDVGLAAIARIASLRALRLERSRVTDAGLAELARLPNLATLTVKRVGITDAGLAHLAAVRSLRTLILDERDLSNPAIAALRAALPGLRITLGPTYKRIALPQFPRPTRKSTPR